MYFKKGAVCYKDILLILFVIIIFSISIKFSSNLDSPTTFASVDCNDLDEDGYLDENCDLETDLGCGIEEEIITSSYNEETIDIYGSYIVYKSDEPGNNDIYLYDGSTSLQISTNINANINPKIYGDYIVWQNFNTDNWDIVLYSISSLTEEYITEDLSHQVSPDISSSWIVWADERNGDWDIYGYDYSSETSLVTNTGDQASPKLAGDILVYTSDESGNSDIYYYDLSDTTSIPVQVTSSTSKENAPETDGTYIVWQTDEADNWDIHGYEISSGTTFIIADSEDNERLPHVDNGIVTWMDDSSGDYNIYYYDINKEYIAQLTDDPEDQITPKIYSNTIYWVDKRSGNKDIYSSIVDPTCAYISGDCDDDNETIYPSSEEFCSTDIDVDCDGTIETSCDEEETNTTTTEETCFVEGIDYNLWYEETWTEYINEANDGDYIYPLFFSDTTCPSSTVEFYIYSVETDGTDYYTGELFEVVEGIVEEYTTGVDFGWGEWIAYWPGEDTYYYFIAIMGDFGVIGDSVLICEAGVTCTSDLVDIIDAEDILTELLGGTTIEEEEEIIIEEEELDCESIWDCSDAEWSDCVEGLITRSLDDCITPDDDTESECWADEYLPDTEKECLEDTTNTEASSDEDLTDSTEEVPFFTWLNLLVMLGILTGYYYYKSLET
ncbi:MAG: hypothetical protein Q8Q35_03700 [Nanoarchaeota archaeon]|nr:hypothetical protein [Nanoarchaeota archaeon]